MSGYANIHEFYKDSDRLIAAGTTLRGLFDAMLGVRDQDMRDADASPQRLRWLAEHWPQRPVFVTIRLNELFNGLQVEHTDDYVLAMIGTLGGRHEQDVRAFMLRHDHALRDELFWRIFEVEGGGEISLANIDKFSREELNWQRTVVLLTQEGTLDRARVLRSCLQALNRDFSAYRAGWFSRVYAALAPTPAEAAADQALLRQCLAAPVTATVSLVAAQLAAVHKAGLLDAAPFVAACGPALAAPKAAAISTLRVLAALAPQADVEAIAQAAAQGLGHPHADVQRAALALLGRLGRHELALAQRETLAPVVAATLPPGDCSTAPEAIVAPLDTRPAAAPVRPWTDADALQRYAALLEDSRDAVEFELALAWLADSKRVATLLAPLAKRARKLAQDDLPYAALLALAALEPASEFLPQTYWRPASTTMVNGESLTVYGDPEPRPTAEERIELPSLVTRLREVAAILQGRAPRRVLLATPTDTQGWVAADALLDRLQGSTLPPLPVDLTQALLRVHPAERQRVIAATGAAAPVITDTICIEWRSRGSGTLKADGSPKWVWWDPQVHADAAQELSATQPALIPSRAAGQYGSNYRGMSPLIAAELALVNPASTLPLVAPGIVVMNNELGTEVEHNAVPVLTALASHPGAWTAETAQLLALAMAGTQAVLRAQAAELLATALPARLDATRMAEGFAACAPAVVLKRWAGSLTDAARIAPQAVVALLDVLLPRLDTKARDIGALLAVLLDESIRQRRAIGDAALREWLSRFTGSSAAAKAARALLELAEDR